jgi:L,D-transpeptidase ErfK/SrfK
MSHQVFKESLACAFLIFLCQIGNAAVFPLPSDGSELVGKSEVVLSRKGETLLEIARRYNVGADEIIHSNPQIPANHRLNSGVRVAIPTSFILPSEKREGIVINLAELRLYYYPKDSGTVVTIPVGIGKEHGWQTPVGETTVTRKDKDPIWRPTPNVQMEAAKNGTPIPSSFPPGPENPLGRYVLRLGWPTYLIHGTNHPQGVGSRVSAGCLRLYPEDAEILFEQVPVGTKVRVINMPYKVGYKGGDLYFEAHPLLSELRKKYQTDKSFVVSLIQENLKGHNIVVNWPLVQEEVSKPLGVPVRVSR